MIAPKLQILSIDPTKELERVEAEQCRRKFSRFVKRAWQEVDPMPLVWSWHLDALCDHLQAVAEGRIDKLLINIPPGHAKSMIVAVLWPAWRWAIEPSWQVITASYKLDLAMRDAVKSRTLIESEWYQKNFTRADKWDAWRLSTDQNVKSYFANDALGFRLCLSVGSGTGYRGNALVIDDPLDAEDAYSKLKRENAIRWKTETMSSRFNDMERAEEVLIMQRLHDEDPSGYLLKAGGWTHLCLMSEFEPERRCSTLARPKGADRSAAGVSFWSDPRKAQGELLFPEKFPAHVLEQAKSPKGMGPIAYEGQHQQQPMPAAGGMVQRAWLGRRWHYPGASEVMHANPVKGLARRPYDPRKSRPHQRFLVTDAAFKKTEDSDLIAIGVFDVVLPDLYLIDWAWRRMGFVETVQAILDLRARWSIPDYGHPSRICIEDKANGSAVIEVLKQKIPGIVAVDPLGSKEARIAGASGYMHGGNVWIAEHHPQVEEAVAEAASFPKAAHDDWIDMLAYGILLGLPSSDLTKLEALIKW